MECITSILNCMLLIFCGLCSIIVIFMAIIIPYVTFKATIKQIKDKKDFRELSCLAIESLALALGLSRLTFFLEYEISNFPTTVILENLLYITAGVGVLVFILGNLGGLLDCSKMSNTVATSLHLCSFVFLWVTSFLFIDVYVGFEGFFPLIACFYVLYLAILQTCNFGKTLHYVFLNN